MKTVYSERHYLHSPQLEFYCGAILECAERPARAGNVHAALTSLRLGDILAPKTFPLDKILRVHSEDYVDFLRTAHSEWTKAGFQGDVFGTNFNMQHGCRIWPKAIEGRAGYYMADTSVSITQGTWEAVESSVHTTLTALAEIAGGEKSAFALCRPPGHHATASVAAGYCFLNNAAIAAQSCLDDGARRVAILDVDYHHGNGTQDIFYQRDDVFLCSLHADPAFDFPYFSGYAHEIGAGVGEGYTQNYPLPLGTVWDGYKPALQDALKRIEKYGADLAIVSLGVDTFKEDPVSQMALESDDYIKMGREIGTLKAPVLFVLEGGYAIDQIGVNVTNVLKGFLKG